MKRSATFVIATLLALTGCSKTPTVSAFTEAEQKKPGNYDVNRQPDPTPELVDMGESKSFLTGTEGDFTVKSANFDIGRVESSNVECAKILTQKKVSAREVQLHLKFGKVESDSQSCDIIVYPVNSRRSVYTYLRVEDTDEGKAARAQADQERQQKEMAEAQQKMADTKSTVTNTVGKSWDVKFGNGETDKWTVQSADMFAQLKNNAGEQVMVMFNPDEKKWVATGGNCVYEVTITGTSAKGKASFCQKAARSAFTATINK